MKKSIVFLSFVTLFFSCTKTENTPQEDTDNFNRTALLINWANNIIVPRYENYQNKVQSLVTDVNTFNTMPTVANLQTLRTSWLEAYKAFQYIVVFNFGKAEAVSLRDAANTYPTNTSGIETNISSGTYNLTLFSQFDKQGFPALDYLLYGLATTDDATVTFYTTNANASNYKQYLTAVANKLKTNIDTVVTDWNSGYKATYIANNGTSIISSVNSTTNNFVKNLEKDIRTGKIGIAAGKFSNGVKYPEKVEAYYKNDVSKILLNEAVKASQDFFNGKHFASATTGESLKSYLDFLNSVRSGQKLSDIINNQYTAIFAANDALSNSFSSQVNTDNSKMITAFDVMQENVVYTKLDMMQALNISIDYVDSDGD
jgi:predicted lipoprotein